MLFTSSPILFTDTTATQSEIGRYAEGQLHGGHCHESDTFPAIGSRTQARSFLLRERATDQTEHHYVDSHSGEMLTRDGR